MQDHLQQQQQQNNNTSLKEDASNGTHGLRLLAGGGDVESQASGVNVNVPESSDVNVSHLVKLAHSDNIADQQESAIGLSVFITESRIGLNNAAMIGPICHALSRLMDTRDRMCMLYAARALKTITVSDAARLDLIRAGLIQVCLRSLGSLPQQNQESLVVARDTLAAMQNLCYDERGASELVLSNPTGVYDIGKHINSVDNGCREFSIRAIANILYHATTKDPDAIQKCILSPAHIEQLTELIPAVVSIAFGSKIQSESEPAAALLANAALDNRLLVALRKSKVSDSNEMTTFKRERLPTFQESRESNSPRDLALYRIGYRRDSQTTRIVSMALPTPQPQLVRYRYLW